MSELQSNISEHKADDTTQKIDLEVGNCIVALNRHFGSHRTSRMCFGGKEVYPIPSSAVIEIMRSKGDKSTSLNALNTNNTIWCFVEENNMWLYGLTQHPFNTLCHTRSSIITFTVNIPRASRYGCVKHNWDIRTVNNITVYKCTTYMIICPECYSKSLPVISG